MDRGEVVIEKLHFQSRPGLYVTGNLYRPKKSQRQAAGHPLRLRPLRPRPRRQQDGLPGPRHVVRPQRLRLPDHRHAATRRDPRHPSRHLRHAYRHCSYGSGQTRREPLVVAGARLHAGRRRVLERHPRPSIISSAGPTSMPTASASPASPAAAPRRSGSPPPTSASRWPCRSAA